MKEANVSDFTPQKQHIVSTGMFATIADSLLTNPVVVKMIDDIKKLDAQVVEAYTNDAPGAEDLDASLDELYERLDNRLYEMDESDSQGNHREDVDAEVTLEEDLAKSFGNASGSLHAHYDKEDAIGTMRHIIADAGGETEGFSDDQVWEAGKEAFDVRENLIKIHKNSSDKYTSPELRTILDKSSMTMLDLASDNELIQSKTTEEKSQKGDGFNSEDVDNNDQVVNFFSDKDASVSRIFRKELGSALSKKDFDGFELKDTDKNIVFSIEKDGADISVQLEDNFVTIIKADVMNVNKQIYKQESRGVASPQLENESLSM